MGSGIKSNNAEFNANLSNIVNEMFGVEETNEKGWDYRQCNEL